MTSHFVFWQFWCDRFEIKCKPRVAGCAKKRENLVQFSSKQENQARIMTFVNNQYQNYQISLNYFFFVILFSKYNKLYLPSQSVIERVIKEFHPVIPQLLAAGLCRRWWYFCNSFSGVGWSYLWNFIYCGEYHAIQIALHLVTAPRGLQPCYWLPRSNCPNSTVATARMLARPIFPSQQQCRRQLPSSK